MESVSTSGDRVIVQMGEHEVAFVLGRGGSTKTKLARVSRCRLEIDSLGKMEIIGKPESREKAKLYISLVLAQRIGPVYIDFATERDDLVTMKVPRDCVGYVTGRNGAALRGIEDEFSCLMFFARDKSTQVERADEPFGRGPADRSDEILAIFGDKRSRCGAQLKVMSSIEHKVPKFYVEGDDLRVPITHFNAEDFVVETQALEEQDFSYALGKMGSTRKKLARAAHCILQYISNIAVFAGTRHEVDCCKQYLKWLMQQRVGGVKVDDKDRTDITVVPVPARVVGFITGARGSNLREVEERSGTFCFTDGDKGQTHSPTTLERVIILSTDPEARKIAERLILERVAIKEHEVTGGPPSGYRRSRSRSPRSYRPRSRSPYRRSSRSPPRYRSPPRDSYRERDRYDDRDRDRDRDRGRYERRSSPRRRSRSRSLR